MTEKQNWARIQWFVVTASSG